MGKQNYQEKREKRKSLPFPWPAASPENSATLTSDATLPDETASTADAVTTVDAATVPQSEPTVFSKIDKLEANLKAQSSELYKRKMQIFDQHVIIR